MSSAAEVFSRSVLERAILENATDIHIEPFADHFKVRLRIPAGLITLPSPDRLLFPTLVRHFKLLAGLDIAIDALPQDGKFAIKLGGGEVEFRISCLPTLYGPSIVLRVLDRERTPLSIESLGFKEEIVTQLKEALRMSFGLIVIAGRTGSGKTTTLYACLRELAKNKDKKILSIEDPIEYALPGVQQVAISENVSFASALRSFLRHDPDVIFVGEIRDRETARLAIQAALTGHLVLTSLHTKSTDEVFSRLIDLGLESYFIESALKFILSQELKVTNENTRVPVGKTHWHKTATERLVYAH